LLHLGLRWVGLIVVVALASGCPSDRTGSAPTSEAMAKWRRDSAAYETALAKWLRDSLVVDSVSRTINTDSLYRLYRKMLHHSNPSIVMQEIACEEWRIRRLYRALPSIEAQRRMSDTVWRPGEGDAVRQMNKRLPEIGQITQGPFACGGDVERLVPAEVNGTPMSTSLPRPIPPRRPR
jgi:hypothetical protein